MLTAEDICDLYASYNALTVLRSRRSGLTCYVARFGETVKCPGGDKVEERTRLGWQSVLGISDLGYSAELIVWWPLASLGIYKVESSLREK